MTKLISAVLLLALLANPGHVLGRTPQSDQVPNRAAFCDKDPRAAVNIYCQDLTIFQFHVTADVKAGTNTDFVDDLNELDLQNVHATDKFIPAVAIGIAANGLATAIGQRPDQQLGSTGNSSGSTSLVSKAGSAELLSLALDTGALTKSVNGTTTTFNSNADQIFRTITRNDPDCILNCGSLGWFEDHILNPTNISASFALAQQSSTTTATTGQASGTTPTMVSSAAIPTGAGKLSGVTARYQVMNKFDPRSSSFRQKWNSAVLSSQSLKDAVTNLGKATDPIEAILLASAPALDRKAIYDAAKKDPTGKTLANFFAAYFQSASEALMKNATLATDISTAMQARAVYHDAWYSTLDQVVGNLVTFEYSYNRALNQPETHSVKAIYAYNFRSLGMLTFNGAVSLYGGTIPPAAKYGRFYYGQASMEYDQTLTGKGKSIQTQLSLAGYWQYQPNPSVLNIPAGTVAPGTNIPLPNGTQEFVGTAGSLWVTQAKITIKGSGGINIPIGVSWSNKTDLLQGSRVGAQVGISYNFSSLGNLFGAKQ